jgi:hypothetical protein
MRAPSASSLVFLAALSCGQAARAADDPTLAAATPGAGSSVVERAVAARAATSGPNEAPKFVRSDNVDAQRSAPGLLNTTSELGRRWWVSRGPADFGVGLGTVTLVSRPTGAVDGLAGTDGAALAPSGTVLTLGMRYKTSDRSAFFADASGWHGGRLQNTDGFAGKVGMEFKSAQSRWQLSYGGLGLHLNGDTRMLVRIRSGGFGIYMRSSF